MTSQQLFGLDGAAAAASVATLTRREREVCEAIASGEKRAAMSARLGISIKTADIHIANVGAKLGQSPIGFGRVWYAAKLHGGNGQA